VWVASVSATHAHLVAELPVAQREYNRVLGKAKCDSSRAIKKVLPGQIWARKGKHKLLRDPAYRENAYLYVRDEQGPAAAVWCHESRYTCEAQVD
jgi:hypothetical protein